MPMRLLNRKRKLVKEYVNKLMRKPSPLDPLVHHESFMKPFKFPSLPNAPFSITDPFLNPPRGALEVFY